MVSSPPDDWVCILSARDRKAVAEASLVLTSVAVDNFVDREEQHWCLYVREDKAAFADDQLETYRIENLPTTAVPPRILIFDSGWAGVLGYLLIIWLLPTMEAGNSSHWRDAGAMEAGRLLGGEWWRAITALTLHGDLGHIVANSAFGALFGLFAGRYLGSGFAWLLIVGSAALGNVLNASLQAEDFRSIGASTATFAALGLVAAFVWRRGYFSATRSRRRFAPVFAAVALLTYTGIGDENTDVLAHFCGFAMGASAGLAAASFDIRRLGRSGQYIAGVLTLLIVYLAWAAALDASTETLSGAAGNPAAALVRGAG